MTDEKRTKKHSLEVTSQPLQDELIAIKERLDAIETIEGISNAPVVKQYVLQHMTTEYSRKIMAACEVPRTKAYLQETFGYKSKQSLDHHLKPLRESVLLRQKIEEDGSMVFEWSNLFRTMPKSVIKSILGEPGSTASPKKASKPV